MAFRGIIHLLVKANSRLSGLLLCAALALPSAAIGQVQPQSGAEAATVVPITPQLETQVEDVVVEGERGVSATTRFVRSIAPPIGDGGLARWHSPVCVGVANMQAEASRVLADRVSDWAYSFGLRIGEPGCTPNIFVVVTEDGDRTASELVQSRRREFRIGAPGSDRGAAALARFQSSGQPIRWWHVGLPVDEDTGLAVGRLRGQPPFAAGRKMTRPTDFNPNGTTGGSRLTRQIDDTLQQAIIVVDLKALDTADFGQIADFVSMVALAQIDDREEPRNFRSILNLFGPEAEVVPGLTEWDRAFLSGLYNAEQNSMNARANVSSVADAMSRVLAIAEAP